MRYAVFRDGKMFKSFISKRDCIFSQRKDAEDCAESLNRGALLGSRFEVREVE